MVNFIITKNGDESLLVVSLKNKPYPVKNSDPKYDRLVEALKAGASEEELDAILNEQAKKVEEAISIAPGFEYNAGIVSYEGEPLDSVLGDYIVSLVRDGFPVDGMVQFVQNLFQNPSYRAVRELYPFLRKGNNAITPDGCFLAYKRIRGDYFDCHSSSVLNKPAALLSEEERASLPRKAGRVTTSLSDEGVTVITMPRNTVDEDSARTCSNGLHVCSFDYLAHFGGDRVIVCKVNPRDVVAIPADYHDTKMRVCRYEIVAELEDMRRDTLGSGTMAPDPSNPDIEVFGVEVCDGTDDPWEEVDAFSSYADAKDEYERLLADNAGVRIVNKNTGAELLVQEPDGGSDTGSSMDDYESTISIEEVRADGTTHELESDVEDDQVEDTLADYVREVVVEGRMGIVTVVRAVRIVNDEVVEVIRKVAFTG